MKANLEGRIVGFDVPHLLEPSQVAPGDPLKTTRTVWAAITDDDGGDWLWAHCLHSDQCGDLPRSAVHTIMPQGYPHSNT